MEARAISEESVTKLVPGASHSLAHLSDTDLLTNTRHLVGKSNQVFAALLQHLAEVEARGVHRLRRCSSLYTYCIYELRLSEDAASRRASAAKLVKRFPALLDAIAGGELHLTGLLMLGSHLTEANHLAVMAHAKFRTKKEIGKLVRTLAPLPQVPDRIEPLGPEPRKAPRNPTHEEFAASLCPVVRELPPGERPRDWANDTLGQKATARSSATVVAGATDGGVPAPARVGAISAVGASARAEAAAATGVSARVEGASSIVTPAQADVDDLPPLTGPQLYQMQFTTTEEHAELIERARALLSHQSPRASLGELHLRAMRLLVAALEKKRFGVGAPARKPSQSVKRELVHAFPTADKPEDATDGEHPRRQDDGAQADSTEDPRQRGESLPASVSQQHPRQCGKRDSLEDGRTGSRWPSRYITAAERRVVFERDGNRCSYVDERDQRCHETHHLQIHHLRAFARGGPNEAANLALRCAAHNALAAEEDFGREHMERKRASQRHETREAPDS